MDRQLIEYLPPVLSDKKEYIALFQSEQLQIESLVEKIECCFENQFISETDLHGIGRYEKMLKINPKGTDDLTIRQLRVWAKYNESTPYTYIRLLEMLNNLCGEGNLFVKIKDLTLSIRIKLEIKGRFEEIKGLLYRVLPANIAVDLSILYNIWKMPKDRKMKWESSRTWKQMKDEVL